MIDVIYLIIFIAWVVLLVGFYYRDYPITAIGAFFIMALGVYIASNGITSLDNWITSGLALVHIGIGIYVVLRGAYEKYKEM